jgi:hypothetical protein
MRPIAPLRSFQNVSKRADTAVNLGHMGLMISPPHPQPPACRTLRVVRDALAAGGGFGWRMPTTSLKTGSPFGDIGEPAPEQGDLMWDVRVEAAYFFRSDIVSKSHNVEICQLRSEADSQILHEVKVRSPPNPSQLVAALHSHLPQGEHRKAWIGPRHDRGRPNHHFARFGDSRRKNLNQSRPKTARPRALRFLMSAQARGLDMTEAKAQASTTQYKPNERSVSAGQ